MVWASSCDHFGIILGSFWDHFDIILEPLWGHLGIISARFWHHLVIILASSWDHFGTILTSSWNHFGAILEQFRHGFAIFLNNTSPPPPTHFATPPLVLDSNKIDGFAIVLNNTSPPPTHFSTPPWLSTAARLCYFVKHELLSLRSSGAMTCSHCSVLGYSWGQTSIVMSVREP